MKDEIFTFTTRIERPAEEVFAWHAGPGAFARLQPPWERVGLLGPHPGIRDGSQVRVRTWIGPMRSDWLVEHRDCVEGRQFRDVLLSGPFAKWEHLHRFEPAGANACLLTDEITWRLPLGAPGRRVAGAWVREKLRRLFAYRHAVTKEDLGRYGGPERGLPKRILVTGASGLVGQRLVAFLQTRGHTVLRVVRRKPMAADEVCWSPGEGLPETAPLEGLHAVIHLAGEPVAGRWTEARKRRILESRAHGTRLLASALAALQRPPEVLVSASAVGFYGDCGMETVTENNGMGEGFLPLVCRAWEAGLVPAQQAGIRTVAVRIGMVLTPAGGALGRMLPAFRWGVGGPIGAGGQYLSWIGIDDLVGAFYHAVTERGCQGTINATAPGAVTSREFAATLGRVLHRPAVLPVPAALLRLALGEMAEELLLTGARVFPEKLLAGGYRFRHENLEDALRHLLGRTG